MNWISDCLLLNSMKNMETRHQIWEDNKLQFLLHLCKFWILMNRYFHFHQENHPKWWNILQFSLTTITEQFFMDTNRKIRLWLLFQLLLVNGYFKPRRRLYFNSWAEPWTKKSVKFLYQNRNIKTWPKLRKLQSIFLLISSFFRVVFVEKSAQWSAWVLKIII